MLFMYEPLTEAFVTLSGRTARDTSLALVLVFKAFTVRHALTVLCLSGREALWRDPEFAQSERLSASGQLVTRFSGKFDA